MLLAWFAENGRDLPWRRTRDPYAILVSEVMLQQTQVERVVPRYVAWLERWPTVEALANDLAKICLEEPGVQRVIISVEKPGAVRFAESVGVELERSKDE